MRSTEFQRSHEEAPCGARNELLNRKSRVRIPPPAPIVLSQDIEDTCCKTLCTGQRPPRP